MQAERFSLHSEPSPVALVHDYVSQSSLTKDLWLSFYFDLEKLVPIPSAETAISRLAWNSANCLETSANLSQSLSTLYLKIKSVSVDTALSI